MELRSKRCRGTEKAMARTSTRPVKVICSTCQKVFRGTSQHKYCSEECKRAGRCRRDHHHVESKNKMILHLMWQFTCYLCGRTTAGDGIELDLDHIVPFSHGGEDLACNLITSCTKCNRRRQDQLFHPLMERELLRIAYKRCMDFGIDPYHEVRIVR
jgi:5-methylcytosine-specific restriction endonuclease McrA